MDVQMPVMDGMQATRRIRDDSKFGSLPVIAMTANARGEDEQQCLDAGMNDFIAKPVVPHLFYAKLGQWLGRGKLEAEPVAVVARPAPVAVDEGEVVDLSVLASLTRNNAKKMQKTLKTRKHTCEEAEDGDVAVRMVKEKLASGASFYDAILMDYGARYTILASPCCKFCTAPHRACHSRVPCVGLSDAGYERPRRHGSDPCTGRDVSDHRRPVWLADARFGPARQGVLSEGAYRLRLAGLALRAGALARGP
jgi:CheY-like chemotaxis protein